MKLGNSSQQEAQHFLYSADGTILSATNPQLVLGRSLSRAILLIQNTSADVQWWEFGSARATAAITSGAVSSITVTNPGFNFTNPPLVRFWGGGQPFRGNTSYTGLPQPNAPVPQNPGRHAKAIAVLGAASVGKLISSITIEDPGAGYLCAPMVFLINSDLDPNGCADPSHGSGSGFELASGAFLRFDATACPTDSIAVFCATANAQFVCRWMD
jgi:hypothetical protein